ncbi:MAG TPA: hypothetical protein VFM02_01950 [Candidatus Paceibacterota bacterium]|nr:hypothetical protein [Candidatus Paceibacterota bacterium]
MNTLMQAEISTNFLELLFSENNIIQAQIMEELPQMYSKMEQSKGPLSFEYEDFVMFILDIYRNIEMSPSTGVWNQPNIPLLE